MKGGRGGYTTADWSVSDPSMYTTTLDAQGAGRALYIAGPAITVMVEGLHFTGGDASGLLGSDSGDAGGGVSVVQSVVTISGCVIYGNTASFSSVGVGGGIHFDESQATLAGNTVAGNVACSGCGMGGSGGGVFVRNGRATLTGDTIIDNTADEGASMGLGGGVTVDGYQVLAVTLSGNTIAGNTDAFSSINFGDAGGGGVCLRSSLSTLTGNIIINNATFGNSTMGGGLCLFYNSSNLLTGTTIVGNTTSDGGGLGIFEKVYSL